MPELLPSNVLPLRPRLRALLRPRNFKRELHYLSFELEAIQAAGEDYFDRMADWQVRFDRLLRDWKRA